MKSKQRWPLSRIVEIDWLDASAGGGWMSLPSQIEGSTLAVCKTVGYFISKDPIRTIVGQSMSSSTGHVSDTLAIPTSQVVRLRFLKGGSR